MTKITVVGRVQRVFYRKSEWGIAAITEDAGTEHKIVGVGVGTLADHDYVKVSGEIVNNPKYGKQIDVESITLAEDNTGPIGLQTWLSRIKDVDNATADKIANTWAHDRSTAFKQIQAVTAEDETLRVFLEWFPEDRFHKLVAFSRDYGPKGFGGLIEDMFLNFRKGARDLDKLAKQFYDDFHYDPYQCLASGPVFRCGCTFKEADKYVMRQEVLPPDSLVRLGYLMDEVLLRKGDTLRDLHDVDAELRKDWNFDEFMSCVASGHLPPNVRINDEDRTYIQHQILWRCEERIEQKIEAIQSQDKRPIEITDDMVQANVDFKLNEQQIKAVKQSAVMPISIITGGAGVGKTTVMKSLVGIFESLEIPVVLAAPTNKAARRLSQQTGLSATSIHKLLECGMAADLGHQFHQMSFHFKRHGMNPFSRTAVIVDECSMVDTRLFAALLDAIGPECQLILVGDDQQLPPIGEGEPFKDFVASKRIPMVELTQIMRTNPGRLLANVTAIRERRIDDIDFNDHETWEFIPIDEETSDEETRRKLVNLCTQIYRKNGQDPYSFQAITPRRQRHGLSVYEINKDFRSINFPHENTRFARGEKGICTGKGDHDLLNGDIFVVNQVLPKKGREAQKMEITPEIPLIEPVVQVRLADRSLEPGWAITVHKYQGCEADLVVFVITDSMGAFPNRNMIYTALTRAKQKAIVIGSKAAFVRSLRAEEETRFTGFSMGWRVIASHETTDDGPMIARLVNGPEKDDEEL